MTLRPALPCVATFALVLASACHKPAPTPPPADDHTEAPSNRIDVPDSVRKNLGITFTAVERRRVAATLRLSGHFELLPKARFEHRAPLAGRVRIHQEPLQPVAIGDLLYTLDAPDWHRLQRELGELGAELAITRTRLGTIAPLLAACAVHEASLRDGLAVLQARVQNLEATRQSVGGQAQELADARLQQAQTQAQIAEAAEKHTQTQALGAELEAVLQGGEQRLRLLLATAASLCGRPLATAADAAAITVLELRASVAGLAAELPVANGGFVAASDLVLATVDPTLVRFAARGLQSDLGRLAAGLPVQIVAPQRTAVGAEPLPPIAGRLRLGTFADPVQRTLELFVDVPLPPPWARPGVAAFVEIETAGGGAEELAIPLAAVMTDGLERVFFRRDPKDPDRVVRSVADLGVDDGRLVEVKSGLVDGDQVVLAGAYALMLASSGTAAKGGHFHADGTWHEEHK
jgi:hypothetical protein